MGVTHQSNANHHQRRSVKSTPPFAAPAVLNEAHRSILIRNRKMPQEKLGNNQTAPLLGESFSIIKEQAQADERIFPYHADSARARFERLCVQAGITDLTFHDLRHKGISGLFEGLPDSRSGLGFWV